MRHHHGPQERFQGHIDGLQGMRLHGWARSVEESSPVTLTLFADQHRLLDFVADHPRSDLAQLGYGEGRHGFAIDLASFQINPVSIVSVEVTGTEFMLRGSGISFNELREGRSGSRPDLAPVAVPSLENDDFDEEAYLARYPDVREAVDLEKIESGLIHYRTSGFSEGRDPTPPIRHTEDLARSQKALKLNPELRAMAVAVGARSGVSPALHECDHLLNFILKNSARSQRFGPKAAIEEYFEGGCSDAERIRQTLERLDLGTGENVLEFAAGFGRVTRHLASLKLTASDIHREALEFLRDRIGVAIHPSAVLPERFTRPQIKFHFIFALSFFSHVPDQHFGLWLRCLTSMLESGGFLLFTTHGETAANKSRPLSEAFDRESGYGYIASTDQPDLSSDIYGSTIVAPHYVSAAVHRWTEAEIASFSAGSWWDLQDEWVLRVPHRNASPSGRNSG